MIFLLVIIFVCKLLHFACEPYLTINSDTIGGILLFSAVESIILSAAIILGWILYKEFTGRSKTKMLIVAGIIFIGALVLRFLMAEYYIEASLKKIIIVIMDTGEYTILIITAMLIIISLVRFVHYKQRSKLNR